MGTPSTDRNLLVGILALQTECVTQAQLIAAMQAWVFQKTDLLEQILLRQNAIGQSTCDFLSAIVSEHLKLNGDDADQSLAAVSSIESMRQILSVVEDPDVEYSLDLACATRSLNSPLAARSDVPSTDLWIGVPQHGDNRFRVLRPHARGGLGQVSVAEDLELHREVALKELQEKYRTDESSLHRFKMEGEITGQLEHPGIVPVYSLGTTKSGTPFYVMRFIRGDSLKESIERLHSTGSNISDDERALIQRRLITRLIDVCNAINYAHSRGVLHRDLKPGNIMLGKHGETLVVDWGLAKVLGKRGVSAGPEETYVPISGEGSSDTRMGSAVGTLAYMSPEQAEGRLDELGPESDVYGLGGTLYTILTSAPPIKKGKTEEMLAAIRSGAIVRPRDLNPQIDPALEAICLKALALESKDRYSTATALAEDLELWLADQPVAVYPEPWPRRAGRWIRRHRLGVTGAVGMLIVATAALLVITTLVRQQNAALTEKNQQIETGLETIGKQRDDLVAQRATLAELSMGVLDTAETTLASVAGADAFRTSLQEKSFGTFQALYQEDPSNEKLGFALARAARYSANQLARTGQRPEAVKRLQSSVELQERLTSGREMSKDEQSMLSETYRDLGNTLKAVGKLGAAAAAYDRGLQLHEVLVKADSTHRPYRRNGLLLEMGQIGLLWDQLEVARAQVLASRVSDGFINLAEGPAPDSKDAVFAMQALAWNGRALDELGRHDEARAVYAKGIEKGTRWLAAAPADTNLKFPLSRLLHWNAEGAVRSQTLEESNTEELDRAIKLLEEIVAFKNSSPSFRVYLGQALTTRGLIRRLKPDMAAAEADFDRAEKLFRLVLASAPMPDAQEYFSDTLVEMAAGMATTDRSAAEARLKEAIHLLEAAGAQSPESRRIVRKRDQAQQRLTALGM